MSPWDAPSVQWSKLQFSQSPFEPTRRVWPAGVRLAVMVVLFILVTGLAAGMRSMAGGNPVLSLLLGAVAAAIALTVYAAAAPRKYSLELRERAVRMYRASEPKPQIKKLAVDLGVRPEALRGWIRQAEAEADAGERDDRLTTDERAELVALRKENAQLKRANDVLRTASAFFAAQLDPTRPR